MGILSWIIFGALAGWVASMIAGTNREQGWLENIIVGIVGAFLGGFLFGLLTGRGTRFNWNIGSFVVAVLGAVVLLFILRGALHLPKQIAAFSLSGRRNRGDALHVFSLIAMVSLARGDPSK